MKKHKLRCVTSTAVGVAIDSIIFISISFINVFSMDVILSIICCQIVFKVLYEIVNYPISRKVIMHIRNLEDGEVKIRLDDNNACKHYLAQCNSDKFSPTPTLMLKTSL